MNFIKKMEGVTIFGLGTRTGLLQCELRQGWGTLEAKPLADTVSGKAKRQETR